MCFQLDTTNNLSVKAVLYNFDQQQNYWHLTHNSNYQLTKSHIVHLVHRVNNNHLYSVNVIKRQEIEES